jgi:hypothetical protein
MNIELFDDLIVINEYGAEVPDVYINCLELCTHLRAEAERLIKVGSDIVDQTKAKSYEEIKNDKKVDYISANANYDYVISLGTMIAGSALSAIGGAMVDDVSTLEDMGFTDE